MGFLPAELGLDRSPLWLSGRTQLLETILMSVEWAKRAVFYDVVSAENCLGR